MASASARCVSVSPAAAGAAMAGQPAYVSAAIAHGCCGYDGRSAEAQLGAQISSAAAKGEASAPWLVVPGLAAKGSTPTQRERPRVPRQCHSCCAAGAAACTGRHSSRHSNARSSGAAPGHQADQHHRARQRSAERGPRVQEFKGYMFKIMGGQDKQGFPMKQGVLTNDRVRLLMAPGDKCFRGYGRRKGERRRKSVRGCIISQDISVLNLLIVKQGALRLSR